MDGPVLAHSGPATQEGRGTTAIHEAARGGPGDHAVSTATLEQQDQNSCERRRAVEGV